MVCLERADRGHRRLQNVTDELRQLKKSLNTSRLGPDNVRTATSDTAAENADIHLPKAQQPSPSAKSPSDSPFGLSDNDNTSPNIQDAILGTCRFEAHEIRELFSLYVPLNRVGDTWT